MQFSALARGPVLSASSAPCGVSSAAHANEGLQSLHRPKAHARPHHRRPWARPGWAATALIPHPQQVGSRRQCGATRLSLECPCFSSAHCSPEGPRAAQPGPCPGSGGPGPKRVCLAWPGSGLFCGVAGKGFRGHSHRRSLSHSGESYKSKEAQCRPRSCGVGRGRKWGHRQPLLLTPPGHRSVGTLRVQ